MGWTDFVNDTGAGTAIIDADDMNANFDWLEETLEPMTGGTKTANTYDLGSSDYPWREIYQSGNRLMQNDVQLTGSTADGFPNTTTTYIWNFDSAADGDQTDVVGSKVLTRAGANALTAAADVLGTSRYNTCGAETYLTSTDTAFNLANTADTDDVIMGGWFYIPDITPASDVLLWSNTTGAAHGWEVRLTTGGVLKVIYRGVSTSITYAYLGGAGWHHIISVRDAGSNQLLYVNGDLICTADDITIGTTQTKFQISGSGHAATDICESGTRFDEFVFRKGALPANISDVIRNIYARSAKKFATKDANGTVSIQGKSGCCIQVPLDTGTTTATNKATLLKAVVKEDGLYSISGECFGYATGTELQMVLTIEIGATYGAGKEVGKKYIYEPVANNYIMGSLSKDVFLVAGDIVNFNIDMSCSAGNVVIRGDNNYQGSTLMKVRRIG